MAQKRVGHGSWINLVFAPLDPSFQLGHFLFSLIIHDVAS